MPYKLSDEYLFDYFDVGSPSCSGGDKQYFSQAITGYESRAEYQAGVEAMQKYNNAGQPQTKFLMMHAAKVERTDKSILGVE